MRPPAITGIDNVSVTLAGLGVSPFAGTSASAPHLAAIAALLLEADPTLTPAEVLAALQSSAADRGAAGFDNTYGAGLADALAAFNLVNVPDLIVDALTGPATGTLGDTLSVSATAENQGAAAGAFDLAFYFSADGVFDLGDTPSATTCSYAGLAAGASDGATCNNVGVAVPASLTAGTYTLFAQVDDLDTVAESDETNNTRAADSGTVTLIRPGGIFQSGFEAGILAPWVALGGSTSQVTAGAARTGSFMGARRHRVEFGDGTGGGGLRPSSRVKLIFVVNAAQRARINLLYGGGAGTVEWDDVEVRPAQFGFETGVLAPWVALGGSTSQVTAGAARTGSFGLEQSGGSGVAFVDVTGLVPGAPYEISAWVRVGPGGGGTPRLWVHDAMGLNAVMVPVAAGPTFQQVKATFVVNATQRARINLIYGGGAGTVEWDDVEVRAVQFDFESGVLAPWVALGGTTSQVTAGAARTGSFGLQQSGGSGLAFVDVAGLVPGAPYEISAWVRVGPGGGSTPRLWVHDAMGLNAVMVLVGAGPTFQQVKATFVVNATQRARINLIYGGGAGTVEWDDVEVRAVQFDFESGVLAPWVALGGTTSQVTAGAARTGSFGLQQSGGAGVAFVDVEGLAPGAPYEISAWVRVGPGGGGTPTLWVHDAMGGNAVMVPVAAGATFQQVTLTFVVNAAQRARINLIYGGGAGTVEWDDVSIFKP